MPKVRVAKVRGDSLSHAEIRAMWLLRMSFKEPGPGFDGEADFDHFSDFCRKCRHVFRLLDSDGRMRGFYLIQVSREQWRGREYIRVMPEYAYVEKAYRGSPAMRLAYLRLAPAVFRHFRLPKFGTATITPSSYLLYTDAFRVFTHGDDDVPEWERSLLDQIGAEFGGSGWDDDRKLIVKNASLRDERPPRRFRSRDHAERFAHYVRQNPDWQEGHQLVCVFPISARNITSTLLGAVKRARGNPVAVDVRRPCRPVAQPSEDQRSAGADPPRVAESRK